MSKPPRIHGDNIVDLSNHIPPTLKPLDPEDLPPATITDSDFLRALADRLETLFPETSTLHEQKPDGTLVPVALEFETTCRDLRSIAESLEALSVIPLPLERPSPTDTWDYQRLRDAYLELADAYEDLYDFTLEDPPEKDDGPTAA